MHMYCPDEGDSHLSGKKLGGGPILTNTLGTRLEGWQSVLLFILCITLTEAHFQMSWRWRQLRHTIH